MRIVLGTNMLVRATPQTSGLARELLLSCTKPPHLVISWEYILSEVSRVLRYPRISMLHGMTDRAIDEFVADVKSACTVVLLPDESLPTIVVADPKDDPIVATAIAGQADVLCSLDRHLRQPKVMAYCRFHGIDVLTDVELIDQLRRTGETDGL